MDMEVRLFWIGLVLLSATILFRKVKGKFKTDRSIKIYKEILEWLDTGAWAVLMASIIMYLFVQAFKIPSGSMLSTLQIGDHLFVNKMIYGIRVPFTEKKVFVLRDIQRGDIVVFKFPAKSKAEPHYGKDFIKRVIGLPEEKVEIKDKTVYINDKPLENETYVQHLDPRVYPGQTVFYNKEEYQKSWEEGGFSSFGMDIRDNFGPITVPEGYYFVMGDNRDQSFDSRFWGPLSIKKIKGKPLVIYWPPTRIRIVK